MNAASDIRERDDCRVVARRRDTEWPTVLLIGAVYLMVGCLVYFHRNVPWWIMLPLGSYGVALYASLQHEILHGHPTGNRLLNEAMVFPTLHFWLPFGLYKASHLYHHNDQHLTDPRDDPESYYLLPDDWASLPGIKQALYRFHNTLCGRMLTGPAISIVRVWSSEIPAIIAGDRGKARSWGWFALSSALTIWFVTYVSGMALWQYLLLFAYPGISLALIRSYCEHRAAANVQHRTIIVEASPFWSLLFLNNNLHVAHHARPAMAWYKLPALYRAEGGRMVAANDGYVMPGYGEIFRRYFLRAKEPIAYPNTAWLKPGGGQS